MDKFFIVGCPRSGTTMVQQALNRHSQVVIPPETKFFFSFLGHSQRSQARHIDRINRDLEIQLPYPSEKVSTVGESRAWYEDMARQYVDRREKPGVTCFGEKTPEHTGHLARIRETFPEAKVLILYRDGRDVASSLTRVPWMSSNLYVNFLVWLYYARIVQNEEKATLPNTYFARYEDIVADPEKEMAGILNFLGLDYEPAVTEGHGNREGVPERELGWKARALERISTNRVATFLRELSDDQVAILERMGKSALEAHGYPLLTDGGRWLSPSFYLSLSWHVSRLLYKLPWRSVLREICCRIFSGSPVPPPVPDYLASRPACNPA